MQNVDFQIHPVFIPMTSRVIIWDFRLRIADLWNRYAQSINGQNSLKLIKNAKHIVIKPPEYQSNKLFQLLKNNLPS
jgi:hypothetical protein